jgi:hypothetical protein
MRKDLDSKVEKFVYVAYKRFSNPFLTDNIDMKEIFSRHSEYVMKGLKAGWVNEKDLKALESKCKKI